MFLTLVIIALIVSVLLVLVVLAQNPKGGGLNTQFGGGGASQLMGVQRTGDLLERLTWVLAVSLMVLSMGAYVVQGSNSQAAQLRSVNVEAAKAEPAPSPKAAAPQAPPTGAATPPAGTEGPPAPADAAPLPAAEETPVK